MPKDKDFKGQTFIVPKEDLEPRPSSEPKLSLTKSNYRIWNKLREYGAGGATTAEIAVDLKLLPKHVAPTFHRLWLDGQIEKTGATRRVEIEDGESGFYPVYRVPASLA